MISQFFVVSPRGDTLIFKDYRGDVSRNTSEKFWRHVKFSKGEAEPVFVSRHAAAAAAAAGAARPPSDARGERLPLPARALRDRCVRSAVHRGRQLHVREEERPVPVHYLAVQPLAVHDPGASRALD
jgi:hypothetical protein